MELSALLFDLDGTLLDLDGDAYLDQFIGWASQGMASLVDPEAFRNAVLAAAIPAVARPHPGLSNRRVLWDAVAQALEMPAAALEEQFDRVTLAHLTDIYPGGGPVEGAHRLVDWAQQRRLRLAVATMPIYARRVVEERLGRAGLAAVPWDFIATDAMTSVKPHPDYFRDIAVALRVPPTACLMVGNDYFQDVPARQIGMETFYTGPLYPTLEVGRHGTLDALVEWLQTVMPEPSTSRLPHPPLSTPGTRTRDERAEAETYEQGGVSMMMDTEAVWAKVQRIVADQLGVEEQAVTAEAAFVQDLGADSLDLVELVMALESAFDLAISDVEAEQMTSVGDVVAYVRAHQDKVREV